MFNIYDLYGSIMLRPKNYLGKEFLVKGRFVPGLLSVSPSKCQLIGTAVGDTIFREFVHSDDNSGELTIPVFCDGEIADRIQDFHYSELVNLKVQFVFGFSPITLLEIQGFIILEIS